MIIKGRNENVILARAERRYSEAVSQKDRLFWSEEIRKCKAGETHEKSVSYELRRQFGDSDDVFIIEDLRLEDGGFVSQIDLVVISKSFDVFVIECKSVGEGMAVDRDGQFVRFRNHRAVGMGSPIQQAQRHIDMLRRLVSSGRLSVPSDMIGPVQLSYHGFAVVPSNARLKVDPNYRFRDSVFKVDDLVSKIRIKVAMPGFIRSIRNYKNYFGSGCNDGAAERFARDLGALDTLLKDQTAPASSVFSRASVPESGSRFLFKNNDSREPASRRTKVVLCVVCGVELDSKTVAFCRFNFDRMGRRYLCKDHQPAK